MIRPEIVVDQAQLNHVNTRLVAIKNGAGRAVSGAINDLMKASRTQLARGATSEVTLKYGRVLAQIRIHRATPGNLAARITVNDKKRPGLTSYGARPTNRGVTYRISKQGGRRRIKDAFVRPGRVWDAQAGAPSAAERTPNRVFKRAGKARKPLVDLKGPSLNRVIKKNEIDATVAQTVQRNLPARIDARVNVLIERASNG